MITIKCSNGEFYISKEDYETVSKYKWYIASHGYVRRTTDKLYLHRFITKPNDNEVVDHKNGNRLDNTRDNLRVCSQSYNSLNRETKGVRKTKYGWKFEITVDGNTYSSPNYITKNDAMIAYNRKAIEIGNGFIRLLDIEDDGRKIKSVLENKKTSKAKGVYLRSDGNKWVAQHYSKGKCKYIGSFNTEEEAINALEKYKEDL